MNLLKSSDVRMKCIKENSIRSFNHAAKFPRDFVEFDVHVGKTLHRKTKDGRIFEWKVENDDPFCTLEEAFHKVEPSVGFNVELKFDDNLDFREEKLSNVLQVILKVVFEFRKDRPIIFSSFRPDAAVLTRKLQITYPVFFLTNGGSQTYTDARRNSMDEAVKLCFAGGLHGIVSEVKLCFAGGLHGIVSGGRSSYTEVLYMQRLLGAGVIVDLGKEISEAVSEIVMLGNFISYALWPHI